MTTLAEVELKCTLCGHSSDHIVVRSSFQSGEPDLDLRDPPLIRYELERFVQCCPTCGYCAPSIDRDMSRAREVVDSADYQEILHHEVLPSVAQSFRCVSLLLERNKQYADAARRSLQAAWICDDHANVEASKVCRLNAIRLLNLARDNEDRDLAPREHTNVLLTDMQRRAGLFADAIITIDRTKSMQVGGFLLDILNFQQTLVEKQDISSYTLADVPEDSP